MSTNEILGHLASAVADIDKARALLEPPAEDPAICTPEPEDFGDVHSDDPNKAREHAAALRLTPRETADRVWKATSGDWQDSANWCGGVVPQPGDRVLVPHGTTCRLTTRTAWVKWLRVEGEFELADGAELWTELVVGTATSKLSAGTAEQPVSAEINLRCDSPLTDPELLGNGIIWHGSMSIHGRPKTLSARVKSVDGDRITLESGVTGWQPGDLLVIQEAGESRVVSSVDTELVIDDGEVHEGFLVVNMSRSFTIKSVGSLPSHVMVMHSNRVDVKWLATEGVGRTDKLRPALEVSRIDQMRAELTEWGEARWSRHYNLSPSDLDLTPNSNVLGRYGFHLHRCGHKAGVLMRGVVATNSPGHGIVQHDTDAVMVECATHACPGGIISETGNEGGAWIDCITTMSHGTNRSEKDGPDAHRGDMFRSGVGFGMASRILDVVGCHAFSSRHGFLFFSRGHNAIDIELSQMANPASVWYRPTVEISTPSIKLFENNTADKCAVGVEVIKSSRTDWLDTRSVLADFTATRCGIGLALQYVAGYTIVDAIFTGCLRGVALRTGCRDVVFNATSFIVCPRGFTHELDTDEMQVDLGFFDVGSNFFDCAEPYHDMVGHIHSLTWEDVGLGLAFEAETEQGRWFLDIGNLVRGVKRDPLGEAWMGLEDDANRPVGMWATNEKIDIRSFTTMENNIQANGWWQHPERDSWALLRYDFLVSDRLTGAEATFPQWFSVKKFQVEHGAANGPPPANWQTMEPLR